MFLVLFLVVISIIVWLAVKFRSFGVLLLFITFTPTLMAVNQSCGERHIIHVETNGLAPALFTFFDLVIEFGSHYHGQSLGNNKWHYSFQLLVEVYSFTLLFFMYLYLKNFNTKGIKENFKCYVSAFYSQIYFWGILLLAFGIVVILADKKTNIVSSNEYSNQNLLFAILYIGTYFILLAIIIQKFFFLTRKEKELVLYLVLLFPIVSLSDDYYTISICQSENYTLQNYPAIYPLVYATPKALYNLTRHWHEKKLSHDVQIVLYNAIQMLVILYLFPSLININNENKYRIKQNS